MRKQILFFAAVAVVHLVCNSEMLRAKTPACGYAGVKFINAPLRDIAQACTALREVVDYFGAMAFAFEPVVTIELGGASDAADGWFRSHGVFDARGLTIRLNEAAGFRAWGISTPGVLGPSFSSTSLCIWPCISFLGIRWRGCRAIGRSLSPMRSSSSSCHRTCVPLFWRLTAISPLSTTSCM